MDCCSTLQNGCRNTSVAPSYIASSSTPRMFLAETRRPRTAKGTTSSHCGQFQSPSFPFQPSLRSTEGHKSSHAFMPRRGIAAVQESHGARTDTPNQQNTKHSTAAYALNDKRVAKIKTKRMRSALFTMRFGIRRCKSNTYN